MIDFVLKDFFCNELLMSAISSWFIAQIIKVMVESVKQKKLCFSRILGSGGMPSSHSATVFGLTTSALLVFGLNSFEFTVCLILSAVVMTDAVGVRQEASKHAKFLNLIIKNQVLNPDEIRDFPKMKEFVGHTAFQVIGGAIVGGIVACLVHWLFKNLITL